MNRVAVSVEEPYFILAVDRTGQRDNRCRGLSGTAPQCRPAQQHGSDHGQFFPAHAAALAKVLVEAHFFRQIQAFAHGLFVQLVISFVASLGARKVFVVVLVLLPWHQENSSANF